jgi:hypothetical protein
MLHERETEDIDQWKSLCHKLHLNDLKIPHLQRLSRGPNSIHLDKPRLLKVTFHSVDEVQRLLLATPTNGNASLGDVRIRADLTRAERMKRKEAFTSNQPNDSIRHRSLIIHGIPESVSETSTLAHDNSQWDYIRSKLQTNAIAVSVARLPRPPHLLTMRIPRLLRVTLISEQAASTLLDAWHTKRNTFSSDIRIHSDRPRAVRQAQNSNEQRFSYSDSVTVNLSNDNFQHPSPHNLSKNTALPVS